MSRLHRCFTLCNKCVYFLNVQKRRCHQAHYNILILQAYNNPDHELINLFGGHCSLKKIRSYRGRYDPKTEKSRRFCFGVISSRRVKCNASIKSSSSQACFISSKYTNELWAMHIYMRKTFLCKVCDKQFVCSSHRRDQQQLHPDEKLFYHSRQPHLPLQLSHWLRAVVNLKRFTRVQNLGCQSV